MKMKQKRKQADRRLKAEDQKVEESSNLLIDHNKHTLFSIRKKQSLFYFS
jgi:hypothetical protein